MSCIWKANLQLRTRRSKHCLSQTIYPYIFTAFTLVQRKEGSSLFVRLLHCLFPSLPRTCIGVPQKCNTIILVEWRWLAVPSRGVEFRFIFTIPNIILQTFVEISLALQQNLLAPDTGQVEFYIPALYCNFIDSNLTKSPFYEWKNGNHCRYLQKFKICEWRFFWIYEKLEKESKAHNICPLLNLRSRQTCEVSSKSIFWSDMTSHIQRKFLFSKSDHPWRLTDQSHMWTCPRHDLAKMCVKFHKICKEMGLLDWWQVISGKI